MGSRFANVEEPTWTGTRYCQEQTLDKFGKEVWLSKVDDWHFKISVPVTVSPQFFAWVFGLGNYVTITAPESVVKQMKDMLDKVSKRYE